MKNKAFTFYHNTSEKQGKNCCNELELTWSIKEIIIGGRRLSPVRWSFKWLFMREQCCTEPILRR